MTVCRWTFFSRGVCDALLDVQEIPAADQQQCVKHSINSPTTVLEVVIIVPTLLAPLVWMQIHPKISKLFHQTASRIASLATTCCIFAFSTTVRHQSAILW